MTPSQYQVRPSQPPTPTQAHPQGIAAARGGQ